MALGAGTAETWTYGDTWRERGWVMFVCPNGCDSRPGPSAWRWWCSLCGTEGRIEKEDNGNRD
jgi:hypothetical protein